MEAHETEICWFILSSTSASFHAQETVTALPTSVLHYFVARSFRTIDVEATLSQGLRTE